jgi:hypothetical protein
MWVVNAGQVLSTPRTVALKVVLTCGLIALGGLVPLVVCISVLRLRDFCFNCPCSDLRQEQLQRMCQQSLEELVRKTE